MPDRVIYIGNDMTLEITGLTNSATGSVVSGADCELTLYDENDDAVTGQVFPVTMNAEGSGRYTGTLESTLDLIPGRNYRAVVDVDAGGGATAQFVQLLRARERTT